MRASASGNERLVVVTVTGLVTGAIAWIVAPWRFALLLGWDAGAVALLVWVWVSVGGFTPERTRELSLREDGSRVASGFTLVIASVASLLGAAFAVRTGSETSWVRSGLLIAGALTVVLSWAVVHTVFALRYADEYYTPPEGGLDFGGAEGAPDYQDFAYLAFTIGMTFQTSDVEISSRTIRRTLLRHALLAYLFGAVIVAVTVNVIASLIR